MDTLILAVAIFIIGYSIGRFEKMEEWKKRYTNKEE